MGLSEVPTLSCQRPGFPLSPQRLLGRPGYLHCPELGSSSSVSPWLVRVPSVPTAAPAWPLVAPEASHPVADNTPCPHVGVLSGVTPVLDYTPRPAACVLPGVAPVLDNTPPVFDDNPPVLDNTPPPTADVLPGVKRSVPPGRLADPPRWLYSSLLR